MRILPVLLICLVGCGSESHRGFSLTERLLGDPPQNTSKICYRNNQCLLLNNINFKTYGYKTPDDPSFPQGSLKNQYNPPLYAIELTNIDHNILLSPFFKLGELMSKTKDDIGLFSPSVLGLIENIRLSLGSALVVNSGYRTPNYNATISGSATWSRHTYGDAVDVFSPGVELQQLKNLCLENGASFTQLYTTHIHCDWRNVPLPKEFYGEIILPRSELSEEDIAEGLAQYAEIQVQGVLRANAEIILRGEIQHTEDSEPDLRREWRVVGPGGFKYESNQNEVRLPIRKGNYHITLVLGGNILLEKTLKIR